MKKLTMIIGAVCVAAAVLAAMASQLKLHVDPVLAAELAQALRGLQIGTSSSSDAAAIAARYGTMAVSDWLVDCTSGFYEQCVYEIQVPQSPWGRLPRFGANRLGTSFGSATIWIQNERVIGYQFHVQFRTSTGRWLGAGVAIDPMPEDYPVQRRVSATYVVAQHESWVAGETGILVVAHLTPGASRQEKERAGRLILECLAPDRGCGAIDELAPDVWRDFVGLSWLTCRCSRRAASGGRGGSS